MKNKFNQIWYDHVRLDDEDIKEEIKEYLLVYGFSKHHIIVFKGEESLVIKKGISSYLLCPNTGTMKLEVYKRDDLNLKKSQEFWLKETFDSEDCWIKAIRFLSKLKNI